jgi:ABC-type transport system involved in multi-copper enzyme maturation permease subunit
MVFLPIVQRELVVASRRRTTYWIRLLFVGVAIGVAVCTLLFSLNFSVSRPQQTNGHSLFQVLSIFSFLYALFAGIYFTADSLSAEKREGTLGLLFLTDLKGYDVILGKLVAHSLDAFYGLLAILPVLGLPLLMGGVTPGEFARVAAVLVNTLFLSLALGIALSAVARQEQMTMGGTFLILLILAGAAPLLGNAWLADQPIAREALLLLSPSVHLLRAFTSNYQMAQGQFWIGLALGHLLAWAFLGLASFILVRTWQESAPSKRTSRWQNHWRNFKFGGLQARPALRARLLAINPILWLNSRDRRQPCLVWLVVLGIVCVHLWSCWKYRAISAEPGFLISVLITINTVLKFWIASEASRRLPDEKRQGAFELLLVTRLRIKDILQGHLLMLWRIFAGPILAVIVLHLVLMLIGLNRRGSSEGQLAWIFGILALAAMLVADAVTLTWVGLKVGMSARRPGLAGLGALTRVVFLPGIISFVFAAIFSSVDSHSPGSTILLWIIVGLSVDLLLGHNAASHLQENFRSLANPQLPPPLASAESEPAGSEPLSV